MFKKKVLKLYTVSVKPKFFFVNHNLGNSILNPISILKLEDLYCCGFKTYKKCFFY